MDAIAFKVVKTEIGKAEVGYFEPIYYSAMEKDMPWEFVLQYIIGHTTVPKIGRIFVFKTYDEARQFINDNPNTTNILKGKATNIGHPKHLAENFWQEGVILEFWKNKILKKKQNIPVKRSIPKGTLTCSTFTPTELIKKEPLIINSTVIEIHPRPRKCLKSK